MSEALTRRDDPALTNQDAPIDGLLEGDRQSIEAEVQEILEILSGEEIAAIDAAASRLSARQMGVLMYYLLQKHPEAGSLTVIAQAVQILRTKSAFVDPDKRAFLEATVNKYPLKAWLDRQGLEPRDYRRAHVLRWVDMFMRQCHRLGYQPAGYIDGAADVSLWNATEALSRQVHENPAAFLNMQSGQVNNAKAVDDIIERVKDAEAFLGVIFGERPEDMSDRFLEGMETIEVPGEENIRARVLWGIQAILDNDNND